MKEITRQYKGHDIVRRENGQMGCPGNQWPGCPTYYEVFRNGTYVAGFGTLKRAKMFVDGPSQKTPEQAARIASVRASLAADVARMMGN